MNAVLTAPSRATQHPPSAPVRRVGVIDRLALRIGLALIMWNRRPARVRHERFVTAIELAELDRLNQARYDKLPPLRPIV